MTELTDGVPSDGAAASTSLGDASFPHDDHHRALAVAVEAVEIVADAAQTAGEVATAVAAEAALARNADNLTSGTVADARVASTIARDSEVTAAVDARLSAANATDLTDGGATTLHTHDARYPLVYTHSAGSYSLTGGRIFVGTEDPSADGFTPTAGDIWYDTTP